MMILHCRQSWEESEMTIGHGPPPTTADQTMQYGEGPAEQQEITPLEPKQHTTRTTTARQLKMDSSQNEKITAKGRDPVKSKRDKGMENNPHKKPNSPTPITTPRAPGTRASQHSQESAQGREAGRAKERKKHPADNPLDLAVAVFTLVASRGVNKKSQDSGTDGTGQKSTTPLQQAVVGIGSTPTEDERLHLHEREGYIPDLPGTVPSSRDSKLIVSEKGQSQPRQED